MKKQHHDVLTYLGGYSVLSIALVLTSGCGSNSGPQSVLSADQETTFKTTLASAGRVYSTARNGASGSSNSVSHESGTLHALALNKAVAFRNQLAMNSSAGDQPEAMNEKLSTAIRNGNCNQSHSSVSEGAMSVGLTGDKCPVSANFKMENNGGAFKVSVDYKFQDPSFQALNDVDQYSLSVEGNVQSSVESMSVDLKANGKFHSQKNGDVSYSGYMKSSGNHQATQGDFLMDYTFPTFQAEVRGKLDGSTQKYTLNGKEITQDEAQEYMRVMQGQ